MYKTHDGKKNLLGGFVKVKWPKVVFEDNSKWEIKRKGSIIKGNIEISEVSYVGGLKYNLLSTSQFFHKEYIVEFQMSKCLIKYGITNDVKLIRISKGNIHTADLEICFMVRRQSKISWLWHRRINNAKIKTFEKLSKLN